MKILAKEIDFLTVFKYIVRCIVTFLASETGQAVISHQPPTFQLIDYLPYILTESFLDEVFLLIEQLLQNEDIGHKMSGLLSIQAMLKVRLSDE